MYRRPYILSSPVTGASEGTTSPPGQKETGTLGENVKTLILSVPQEISHVISYAVSSAEETSSSDLLMFLQTSAFLCLSLLVSPLFEQQISHHCYSVTNFLRVFVSFRLPKSHEHTGREKITRRETYLPKIADRGNLLTAKLAHEFSPIRLCWNTTAQPFLRGMFYVLAPLSVRN